MQRRAAWTSLRLGLSPRGDPAGPGTLGLWEWRFALLAPLEEGNGPCGRKKKKSVMLELVLNDSLVARVPGSVRVMSDCPRSFLVELLGLAVCCRTPLSWRDVC